MRTRSPHGVLLRLLAVSLLLSALADASSASAQIKLGVFTPGATNAPAAMSRFTQMVGGQPEIVLYYRDFGDRILYPDEAANLRARGQTPIVTLEPHGQALTQIATGTYDGYLHEQAHIAADWGSELLVRFAHEMNGDWYPWGNGVGGNTPADYLAAWRHVVSVFRAEGAANVRWVWSPNVDDGGRYPIAPFFPGDGWVDYVGLDGYNWGGRPGERWRSLEEVFVSSYATVTRLSAKPILITEVASSEAGGDKAAWIRDGFLRALPRSFPRVSAVIWFNKIQEDDWRIDSSPASLQAYRDVVDCLVYGGSGSCSAGSGESGQAIDIASVYVTQEVSASAPRVRGTVSFRINHQAKVWIKVERRTHRRRFVRCGSLRRHSHAGRNRVRLARAMRRGALRPGRYRVVLRAFGRDGRRSKAHTGRFWVTR